MEDAVDKTVTTLVFNRMDGREFPVAVERHRLQPFADEVEGIAIEPYVGAVEKHKLFANDGLYEDDSVREVLLKCDKRRTK